MIHDINVQIWEGVDPLEIIDTIRGVIKEHGLKIEEEVVVLRIQAWTTDRKAVAEYGARLECSQEVFDVIDKDVKKKVFGV